MVTNNNSQVKAFVNDLVQGKLPELPTGLNGLSSDCEWLYSQASKHQSKAPEVRTIIIKSLVNDLQKKSSAFGDAMKTVQEVETSHYPPLPIHAQLPTGKMAEVSPWLTRYIEYSKRLSPEGYKDFHMACGLWVLSTAAARRIQVPLSDPVITPLSIVLVGRTSLFAKTTTAKAGIRLLKQANLGFLLGADETTPQKLLFNMSGHVPANYGQLSPDRKDAVAQRLAMAGQLGWYYDEFNQLINAMTRPGPMAEFAGLLRKLDNCAEEYDYQTKSGDDHITNPYLAFLGSTTPANIAKHASKGSEFWNDGMWARMLFVAPPPNDFVTQTMEEGIVYPPQELIDELSLWNKRLGVPECWITEVVDDKGKGTGEYTSEVEPLRTTSLKIATGVLKSFATYREALRSIIADRNAHAGTETQDLDGSYSRLPTIALRIAALLASLEHGGLITMDVWALAQELSEQFRENLHRLYEQVSQPVETNQNDEILINYLKDKGKQTVRDIQKNGSPALRRLKAETIRGLLVELKRSGITVSERDSSGKEWYALAS